MNNSREAGNMTGNRCIAEGIGTFALVFSGCSALVVNDIYGGQLGHVGVSMVFGLVVMAMIYSVGNISGAHINPAVTLGFLFSGRLKKRIVLPYIASQLSGALVAGIILRLLFPDHLTLGSTVLSVGLFHGFVIELILTFLLMFVILNVSTGHKEKGIMAGVAVGGTVMIDALFGGPMTGASMNPARSLGPALMSGNLESIWIYLSAPVLGALLACPACRYSQGGDCCIGDGAC